MARWLVYYKLPMVAMNGEKQTKYYVSKTRWKFIAILTCLIVRIPWLRYEREGAIGHDQVKTTCVDGQVFHNYLDWCAAGAPAVLSIEITGDRPKNPSIQAANQPQKTGESME